MLKFLRRLFGGGNQSPGSKFRYAPVVSGGRVVRNYPLGEFSAELKTDLKSPGFVEYTHLLSVFGPDNAPVLFVAAEVNGSVEEFGGGSHFLGVFDGIGHASHEDSDEWADLELFAAAADKLARELLSQ